MTLSKALTVVAGATLVAALALPALGAGPIKVATYKLKNAATGKAASLEQMKGHYKAIYVDFFAQWCGPCQMAIPEIIKLHHRLGSKGVAFIGVDVQDTWQGMKQDIKDRGIDYTVLHDPAERSRPGIWEQLKLQGIPTVMILDGKTLEVKGTWIGFDQSGGQAKAQLKVLKSLGVKA